MVIANFAIVRVCARPVSPVMMLPELFSVSTPPHFRSTSPACRYGRLRFESMDRDDRSTMAD